MPCGNSWLLSDSCSDGGHPEKPQPCSGIKMKAIFLILTLLVLMSACASTEGNKLDPKVAYGGSYQVRGTVSHGVGK